MSIIKKIILDILKTGFPIDVARVSCEYLKSNRKRILSKSLSYFIFLCALFNINIQEFRLKSGIFDFN